MPVQAYFASSIGEFLDSDESYVLGVLTSQHHLNLEEDQRRAWEREIAILRASLYPALEGQIYFECYVPRMGKRADVVLILGGLMLVLEFKVGANQYSSSALDQVVDYALDFKNFHEGSHGVMIVPILVATGASSSVIAPLAFSEDQVAFPVQSNASDLRKVIGHVCASNVYRRIDVGAWEQAGYRCAFGNHWHIGHIPGWMSPFRGRRK